jgi:nickel/cobalt transporter (NiCoT) family protein
MPNANPLIVSRPRFFPTVPEVERGFRLRLCIVLATIGFLQISAWGAAITAFWDSPSGLGLAAVAFALGLRHGFDADHIAAIDNFARRMVGRGERPAGVGLFFSLGHCSVVLGVSFMIAITALNLGDRFTHFRELSAFGSTLFSIFILFAIAPLNLAAAWRLYTALRESKSDRVRPVDVAGGLMTILLRPLLRYKVRSWQMLFVGIVFGLGFETATAVALLGIAASEAGYGLPLSAVMVFPLLFTAGMTLVDTSQGIFMVGAYGWALVEPRRKLVYNLIVTSLSGFVALVVGIVELLTIMPRYVRKGSFLELVDTANSHFEELGELIVAIFALTVALFALARLRDLLNSYLRRSPQMKPLAPQNGPGLRCVG